MSRYDLTGFEWNVIDPLLPNKPRGVPRVVSIRAVPQPVMHHGPAGGP